VTTLFFALTSSYLLALAMLLIGGIANLASMSIGQTIVQLLAPPADRGRIIGLYGVSANGLRAGSGFTVGILGAAVGIHWSLGLSSVAPAWARWPPASTPCVTARPTLPETYGAEGAPGAIVFILEIDRDGYVISAAVFTLPYARREQASHDARRTSARDCTSRQPPGTELRIQRRTIDYRFQPRPDQVLIRQNDPSISLVIPAGKR
jgi:MFS family permease